MILILGEHHDISTDKVCAWLNFYKAEFIRINSYSNSYNIIKRVNISEKHIDFELIIDDKTVNFNEIDCIWCRRGYTSLTLPPLSSIMVRDNKIPSGIMEHIENENNTLNGFLEYIIEQKIHINNKNHYNSNKLIALETAARHGLKIPETLITKNSEDVRSFMVKYKSLITKNIQDNLSYHDKNFTFGQSTSRVDEKDIKTKSFFYSLFQPEISKKYEIRTFYINRKFFSHVSIPPENNENADIRNSNNTNRILPFDLPRKIKTKITAFMNELKLESGSIDMIIDKDDNYFFLEVNPVGQFDFLNGYNNYYIEKEIAKILINEKKN